MEDKCKFCEQCGSKLVNKKCENIIEGTPCGFIKFHNPIPVSVCLIPVFDEEQGRVQLLGVIRGVQPKKGEIALPGGFQEIEPVLSAGLREVKEETGIDLESLFPNHPELLHPIALVVSTPDNRRNLMFFRANVMIKKSDIDFNFVGNEGERPVLIDLDTPLAFPLHKKAVDWYYE